MRWKLVVGNVLAVLLVGILGWMLSRGRASEELATDVAPSVDRATSLLDAVRAQDGDQLVDAVEAATHAPDIAAVLSADSESAQRDAAFTFSEAMARQIGAQIQRRGRPADLVAVLSPDGRVLGRNADRRLDAGRNVGQEFPAVAHALSAPRGHVVRDYIRYGEQGWLEVAVAPVMVDDHIRGGLLVGFVLADSASRSDAQRIGVDVGYLFREGDGCMVQSLSVGQQREKEQLRAWCTQRQLQTLLRGRQSTTLTLGDDQYLAMTIPMPGAYSAGSAGAVVLRSITASRAPANDVAFPMLLAMLLGLVVSVGYNLYIAMYFEKPIEQIEDGLLQIINGNREHRINVEHAELGGIVYRVNQLVGELTGVDEDNEGSGGGSGESGS
jgi:HAMP domain-containing protein